MMYIYTHDIRNMFNVHVLHTVANQSTPRPKNRCNSREPRSSEPLHRVMDMTQLGRNPSA